MSSPVQPIDGRVDGTVLDVAPGAGWPVETQWRAAVVVQGTYRAPEWILKRIKAVPLSSRAERTLLAAVVDDNGRQVLEMASNPGEHHVAAAVIAALRLAETHPDRAIRFLDWLEASPTDPGQLRFLRRYLPGLEVLVEVAPEVPMALPASRTALTMLEVELLRKTGSLQEAEAKLASLPTSRIAAIGLLTVRLERGDLAGVRELGADHPVFDDVSGVLAVGNAQVRQMTGDSAGALDLANQVLDLRDVASPVVRAALKVRAAAQRSLGRDVDASLTESELGIPSAPATSAGARPAAQAPEPPSGPLYGRSLTDALDDAWARVRRQPHRGTTGPHTPEEIEQIVDEAVALIAKGQYEAAEAMLLTEMDRTEDAAEAGAPIAEEFFVVLAGSFDQQHMPPEEVATLERLRAAHTRVGTNLSDAVQSRLIDATAALDALG